MIKDIFEAMGVDGVPEKPGGEFSILTRNTENGFYIPEKISSLIIKGILENL